MRATTLTLIVVVLSMLSYAEVTVDILEFSSVALGCVAMGTALRIDYLLALNDS
jgi:hypothetical protein